MKTAEKQAIHIHVIEDEKDIAELLIYHFTKEGYRATSSCDGLTALSYVLANPPDVLLLDLMLPGLNGLELCRIVKASPQCKNMQIIMLTAKGSEDDIVKGLELGADDYMTKPFSPKVVLARVHAVLRRRELPQPQKAMSTEEDFFCIKDLKIHLGRHEVYHSDRKIDLTNSEFQILWFLANKPGWVFTRSQLVDHLRGENHAITDRAIDVQIVGLRKKLGEGGNYIETVRGVGYRFVDPV